MPDNIFIDSNIAVYALDLNITRKKEIALKIIEGAPVASPQVIFECLNIFLRKLKHDKPKSLALAQSLVSACFIQPEIEETLNLAMSIFTRYLLQPYDSKIVAAALVAGCTTLYSEDMQHGLVIENSLTIVNPFL